MEDTGDFSDFYIPPAHGMSATDRRQLQELQDEELARLLQDQEHKTRKGVGSSVVWTCLTFENNFGIKHNFWKIIEGFF